MAVIVILKASHTLSAEEEKEVLFFTDSTEVEG